MIDLRDHLEALKEKGEVFLPAKVELDEEGRVVPDNLIGREEGEVVITSADKVTAMDVSPNQLVSVAASMIPFLDNDDANRALMGSNMQRQGVPLLRTASPIIGTGIEKTIAHDSGVCLLSGGDGVVEEVDSKRVVVRYDEPGTDVYTIKEEGCVSITPIKVRFPHRKTALKDLAKALAI